MKSRPPRSFSRAAPRPPSQVSRRAHMSIRVKPLVLCIPLLIASCANVDQKTQETGIGAAIGCAAGAAIAKLTSNNAAGGCAAGAVVGGIAGYLHARSNEID